MYQITRFISPALIKGNRHIFYVVCSGTPLVREWVESHNVSIQVGDVFKHMSLPEYEPANAHHCGLAALVENPHSEHDKIKRGALVAKIEVAGEAILKTWMPRVKP